MINPITIFLIATEEYELSIINILNKILSNSTKKNVVPLIFGISVLDDITEYQIISPVNRPVMATPPISNQVLIKFYFFNFANWDLSSVIVSFLILLDSFILNSEIKLSF